MARVFDVDHELRDLGATGATKRERACDALWGALCNQGSVDSASLAAVGPLTRHLRAPRAKGKDEVLALLVGIAVGDHSSFLDGSMAPARLGKRPKKRPAKTIEARCYEAVATEVPLFRSLVADGDPPVRAAAAFALAWFGDDTKKTGLALLERARVERDPATTASILIALGHLGTAGARPLLEAAAEGTASATRVAGAIGLVYLEPKTKTLTADVRALLDTASAARALKRTAQPWNGGDLAGHAAAILRAHPQRAAKAGRSADDVVLAKLRTISYAKGQALAAEVVPKLFSGSKRRRSMTALTDPQRAFLETLMTEGIGTPGSDLDRALAASGLPKIEGLPKMTGMPRGVHPDYKRR